MIPTKHLSTIREQEAIILYALMKGYKFDVGKIIELSIRCFHKNVKRGLVPHQATITMLCILAGVQGIWVEEETCPKVSPLTLIGVTKGPKNRKMKEMEIVEVEEEPEEEEHEQLGMEQILVEGQQLAKDEMQSIRSPLIHSPPDVRQTFSKPAECFQEQSRKYKNYGDAGINEKGNGGEREEMGRTKKDQRGVSGG